jgi:opacity protein-like surface antigen
MDESYGGAVIGFVQGGKWFRGRMGLRAELDLFEASGIPPRVDYSWNHTSSKIKMRVVTLSATYLHSLRKDPVKQRFLSYVGMGLNANFGAEKLSANASRGQGFDLEEFAADVWSLRSSVGTHMVLGTRVLVTGEWGLALELRWTQCGKGNNMDLVEDDEEEQALKATLYDAVRRSNFSLSGWSIRVGYEW